MVNDKDEEEIKLSQDGYEESMPGYQDDADELDAADPEGHLRDAEQAQPPMSRIRLFAKPKTSPPHVVRERARSSSSEPSSSSLATSNILADNPASVVEDQQSLVCPICSKTMETDNRGLNEHIDFCLSRSTILAAQSQASGMRSQLKPKIMAKRMNTLKRPWS